MPAATRKAPGAPGPHGLQPVEAAGPAAPRSFRGCRSGTPAGWGSPVTLQLWLIIPGGVRAARRCRAPSGFPGAPPAPRVSWASLGKAAEFSSSWECKGQEVVGAAPAWHVLSWGRSKPGCAAASPQPQRDGAWKCPWLCWKASDQRNFSLENSSGGRGNADRA